MGKKNYVWDKSKERSKRFGVEMCCYFFVVVFFSWIVFMLCVKKGRVV